MSSKFTKGPWYVNKFYRSHAHKRAELSDYWAITGSTNRAADEGKNIAQTYTEANAQLISTAPELRKLVQTMRNEIAFRDRTEFEEQWLDEAEALLARTR